MKPEIDRQRARLRRRLKPIFDAHDQYLSRKLVWLAAAGLCMLVLFGTLGIKGYKVMSGAGGSGETGTVSGTHGWTDRNMLFLVALDNDPMARLVNAAKKLHASLVTEHGGHEVAL